MTIRASLERRATKVAAAIAFAAAAAAAATAVADPIEASAGTWSGATSEASSGWEQSLGKLELRVEGDGKHFTLNLAGASGTLIGGEYVPGGRENVFEQPMPRGVMSFIRRKTKPEPLGGDRLSWARRAGDTLVVYLLDLRGGPFRLDRVELSPAGDRMKVVFERREHERSPERFTATLERRRP